jgi:hypothetical protein
MPRAGGGSTTACQISLLAGGVVPFAGRAVAAQAAVTVASATSVMAARGGISAETTAAR